VFDWLPAYQQFLVDITLIQILLVLSVAILFQCGLFSLASAGFMAIGAYTSALLVTRQDWPVAGGLVMAMLVGGALSLLFGLPVLRLRGIYLALGSLALAQAVVVGISNVSFTNGVLGISGIPVEVNTTELVIIAVAVCVVLQLIHRSHFLRAMSAIRLDERTAQGLGINVFRYRLTVFTISGAMAGLAGALEAHRTGVISPDQYGFSLLIVVFTYALVGGVGHWIGPMLATVAFRFLQQNLDFVGTDWENAVYGGVLVLVVLVAPNGLTDRGLYRRLGRRLRRSPPVPAVSTAALSSHETQLAGR
jgi:branched-chain amino acid transport system permease protein